VRGLVLCAGLIAEAGEDASLARGILAGFIMQTDVLERLLDGWVVGDGLAVKGPAGQAGKPRVERLAAGSVGIGNGRPGGYVEGAAVRVEGLAGDGEVFNVADAGAGIGRVAGGREVLLGPKGFFFGRRGLLN
jgi:hypothetical protein